MTPPEGEHWPAEAARDAVARLPPERDDEPASLRQDIRDELADHLACAHRRELLRTDGDAILAERNVRAHFGDPGRVALRLWLDAMRGKLMTQRILMATCGVVVATCVLFGILLWRALGRLDEIAARPGDPEWNPMSVRCVVGAGGRPARGFEVSMSPYDNANGPGLEEATGPDGLVDCGLRRPGTYRVSVAAPWDERCERRVAVQPGRAADVEVACPQGRPATAEIKWEVSWPDRARGRDDLWYVIWIGGNVERTIGDDVWRTGRDERLLAFHPDGRAIDLALARGGPTLASRVRLVIEAFRDVKRPPGSVRTWWADIGYTISYAGVFRWDGKGPRARILENPNAAIRYRQPGERVRERWNNIGFGSKAPASSDLAPSFLVKASTARGSRTTTWSLTVPEDLVASALDRP